MDLLTDIKLRELASTCDSHCVSLYLPTHRKGQETRQDPVRLKGLIEAAEDQLVNRGMRAPEARQLLTPPRRLLDDGLFWSHQADGLAIFLTPFRADIFRLPQTFEVLTLVGERFHLTPLFALLAENASFHILALSPKRVRLLHGERDTVESVEVAGLPSFEELLEHLETTRSLKFHMRTPAVEGAAGSGTGPRRFAPFHGQGVGPEGPQWKTRLLEYCQLIDNALRPYWSDSRNPLVLAAESSLVPIFRRANSYAHLLDDYISGSPDNLSDKELHEAAWSIMSRRVAAQQADVLAGFGQAAAQACASTDPAEILPAAWDGRVETLLVAERRHCWGRFVPETRQTEMHDDPQAGDEDLINVAALNAYQKGSRIYTFDPEAMAELAPLAAVYRY